MTVTSVQRSAAVAPAKSKLKTLYGRLAVWPKVPGNGFTVILRTPGGRHNVRLVTTDPKIETVLDALVLKRPKTGPYAKIKGETVVGKGGARFLVSALELGARDPKEAKR